MNIFVNIDVFIHLYIFRLLCNARMQKKNGKRKPRRKEGYCLSLKILVSKYITLKRNENEFSLLRRCRPCFSAEKRVSVEIRRSKTLASKFSRLYYSIFYAFFKRIRPAVKILEFTHHLEKQSFYFYLSTCICNTILWTYI